MLDDDLVTLMNAYARLGISHWQSAKGAMKKRGLNVFGNYLEVNDVKAVQAIEKLRGRTAPELFIPMPIIGHKGIERCFFSPRKDGDQLAFDLLLFCTGNKYLGFRFEPAQRGAHQYPHIQMNRTMLRGNFPVTGIPAWVPDKYPAFPLRTTDPLEMFFSMITSIHGYPKKMDEVLRETFASEPGLQKVFWDRLTRYLTGEPRHQ